MAIEKANAANDVPANPTGDGLTTLMANIVAALDLADRLDLPLVAIHLDHALALCHERTTGQGGAS